MAFEYSKFTMGGVLNQKHTNELAEEMITKDTVQKAEKIVEPIKGDKKNESLVEENVSIVEEVKVENVIAAAIIDEKEVELTPANEEIKEAVEAEEGTLKLSDMAREACAPVIADKIVEAEVKEVEKPSEEEKVKTIKKTVRKASKSDKDTK